MDGSAPPGWDRTFAFEVVVQSGVSGNWFPELLSLPAWPFEWCSGVLKSHVVFKGLALC